MGQGQEGGGGEGAREEGAEGSRRPRPHTRKGATYYARPWRPKFDTQIRILSGHGVQRQRAISPHEDIFVPYPPLLSVKTGNQGAIA